MRRRVHPRTRAGGRVRRRQVPRQRDAGNGGRGRSERSERSPLRGKLLPQRRIPKPCAHPRPGIRSHLRHSGNQVLRHCFPYQSAIPGWFAALFHCWRALFKIVLGLMCPGRPSRGGESQNEAKSRRFGMDMPCRAFYEG